MRFFSTLILTLLIFFSGSPLSAQPTSKKRSAYKEFVLDGEYIWLLTSTGTISRVKQAPNAVSSTILQDTSVITLVKDRRGNIIIGDSNHRIRQYDRQTQRWSVVNTYTGKLFGIVFNAANRGFAITNTGIVDLADHTWFFPDSTMYLNHQIRTKTVWFEQPTYLMDKDDRIWVGFNYGEWGGDIFVFDVASKTFVKLRLNGYQITLNPVQAFVQGSTNVFMTTGMAHFTTHGSIVKFDGNSANVVLQSDSYWKPISSSEKRMEGGEYIGPGAFNFRDNNLYIYSQHGIFKGDPRHDLSTISKWTLAVKPQLRWNGGQPNAVGPGMNVLKMEFSPEGVLFFLTELNGLGIYNGKNLRFIK